MSMSYLTGAERQAARTEARTRIAAGESGQGLVHLLWQPGWAPGDREEFGGLSTALPPGSGLSGYTGGPYYTLGEVAA